jgi:hypothetical protein
MATGRPPDPPPDQVRDKPIVVDEALAEAPPVMGIFQPFYYLTYVEFMAIRSPSRFWSGTGSVLCTFAIAYALPKVIDRIQSATQIVASDWKIIGGVFGLGLACFGVSWIFSSERRTVLKSIKEFFKNNPGQPGYRAGKKG